MAEFLKPEITFNTNCADAPTFGRFSTMYDYPTKAITQASEYPSEACQPWLHYNMRLGNLQIDATLAVGGTGAFGGVVTAPLFKGTFQGPLNGTASGNKSFDIPHVTKPGKRIRHVCAEGPEPGIYIRGRLKNSNKIILPEYWEGLINPDSITVTLTQIGYSQDLIVESIDWGKVVKVKSGTGANIDCFYDIWAARWVDPNNHDEKLHVVYDGESPADYPGNNDDFIVGGFQ